MKIDDDHMYHGAALIQIAEHPAFTAINSAKFRGATLENTFQVNLNATIHLKYAVQPKKPYSEYVFNFQKHHIAMLQGLAHHPTVFIGLACVKGREICCIPFEKLKELIAIRESEKGSAEDQYTLLVTLPKGKQFRVYMNAPGKRNAALGRFTVPRNNFPECIFS